MYVTETSAEENKLIIKCACERERALSSEKIFTKFWNLENRSFLRAVYSTVIYIIEIYRRECKLQDVIVLGKISRVLLFELRH